jgi:hypothetical protein
MSKIVTAGLSTSLVLGLVTAMGWHANGTVGADTGTTPQPTIGPITLVSDQQVVDPAAVVTVPAPLPAAVEPIVQPLDAVPAAPTPTTAAPAPIPVVIDVAVPAPQPAAQPASNGASNGQTKQSK